MRKRTIHHALHAYGHYKRAKLNPYQMKRIKAFLFLCFSIATFLLLYLYIEKHIVPTVMAMSEIRGTVIATEAVNKGIKEALEKNDLVMEELVNYDYNQEGELISWDVNTLIINTLCADIITQTMASLDQLEKMTFKIPFGQLSGSRLFANIGPRVKMSVHPLGFVSSDYENEIVAAGINQINHTVWLEVRAKVKVVIPLFKEEVEVVRRVVLIDKVMSGKVPSSYIYIPEKNVEEIVPEFIGIGGT